MPLPFYFGNTARFQIGKGVRLFHLARWPVSVTMAALMRASLRAITILFWCGAGLASSGQQMVVEADSSDVSIFDYNADNRGDLPWSAESSIAIVGENGADGFEHRSLVPFVPTAEQRAAIADALGQ